MIKIEPQEVRDAATNIKNQKDQMNSAIENAKGKMNNLEPNFTGNRAKRIFDEWHSVVAEIPKALDKLDQAVKILNDAASAFQTADDGK